MSNHSVSSLFSDSKIRVTSIRWSQWDYRTVKYTVRLAAGSRHFIMTVYLEFQWSDSGMPIAPRVTQRSYTPASDCQKGARNSFLNFLSGKRFQARMLRSYYAAKMQYIMGRPEIF